MNKGFLTAAGFLAFVVMLTLFHKSFAYEQRPRLNRLVYMHYHKIKAEIEANIGEFKNEKPVARIYKNGKRVTGIGNQEEIKFKYNDKSGRWRGFFPVPWRAENGRYEIFLDNREGEKYLGYNSFFITTRKTREIERPLKVLTLESLRHLNSFRVRKPGGEIGGYESIFDWLDYMGGNTIWYMGGQTAAYREGFLKSYFPWVKSNYNALDMFSEAASERDVSFGAWISCYRIFGPSRFKPDFYRYSHSYRHGRIRESKGISITDIKRKGDIINMARRLNKMENVDYIGLDYIRPARGGFELVDQFVASMNIDVPEEWSDYTKKERKLWLAQIVSRQTGRDDPIIDKWNWWRAHRMSNIIVSIREEAQITKPLWAFVLSWQVGHEHGQDPIMFHDAGIDMFAVMMYEADRLRFNHMTRVWQDYIDGFKINMIPGNQIDWPVHQNTVYPAGPEEFGYRLEKTIERMGDNVRGAFVNDFSRAMWGRKGPYTSMEWLIAAARGLNSVNECQDIDLRLKLDRNVVKNGSLVQGELKISNTSGRDIENIKVEFPELEGVVSGRNEFIVDILEKGKDKIFNVNYGFYGSSSPRLGRYMAAVKVSCGSLKYFDYEYVWVKDIPVDPGVRYR